MLSLTHVLMLKVELIQQIVLGLKTTAPDAVAAA